MSLKQMTVNLLTLLLINSNTMVTVVVLDSVAVDQPGRLETELEQPSIKQHKLQKLLVEQLLNLLQLQVNFLVRAK